jgi:anti-sigma regulatory factor (Ser/Thr protein kinase)
MTGVTHLDCASPADLARARRLVRRRGAEAALDEDVVADLELVVTEMLTNALVHGAQPVLLHLYPNDPTWACHVEDGGRLPPDPHVGTTLPDSLVEGGRGMWIVRLLCAAVEVESDVHGTHAWLHVDVRR